jgi:hypothetical protein
MKDNAGLVTVDHVLQVLTAAVALASLLISLGAYRRSGARVKVRAARSGFFGEKVDPAFARSIVVYVWNLGDAPVTIEHWGFDYCNRLGLPPLRLPGRVRGIGAYNFNKRKGELPHRLEPGDPRSVFGTALSEMQRQVKPGQRLRAYVIVGNRPRRVRDWRFLSVEPFSVLGDVDDRGLLARALRRKPTLDQEQP